MTYAARWMKAVLTAVLLVAVAGVALPAQAVDLPLAAASPLTGVAFDDRPLLLPVQRNFQMAMLTATSELGRSCGKMEAYGWRMSQTEQGRVNQIFNNTVDRLRLLGYTIAPQVLSSVSNDITLFTADRADKHFLFLWSAGELGLVLNLCETSAPLPSASRALTATPSVQVFPVAVDVVSTDSDLVKARPKSGRFTPVGAWVGGYTCEQGYTGGTLQISKLHGQNFEGVFKFYPTVKNPSVPEGSYTVYGQYDAESNRILINPGKWIERPKNFYNTVIVGGFDPVKDSFSAYFQGISGCTSFEANRLDEARSEMPGVAKAKKIPVKKKKRVKAKKKPLKKAVKKPEDTGLSTTTPGHITVGEPAPLAPAPVAPVPAPPAPAATAASPIVPPVLGTPAPTLPPPAPVIAPIPVPPAPSVAVPPPPAPSAMVSAPAQPAPSAAVAPASPGGAPLTAPASGK